MNLHTFLRYCIIAVLISMLYSCSTDEESINAPSTSISITNIELTVPENPSQNEVLGSIVVSTSNGLETPELSIVNQSAQGAVTIDGNNLIVNDVELFEFERNREITGQIEARIGDDRSIGDFSISLTSVNFVTTWLTTSSNESITIYTDPNLNYNYTVEWGDGTMESSVSSDATHSYASPGTYPVTISGTFPAITNQANSNNASKLRTIENWGDISWQSMSFAFANCNNLISTAADIPDLSSVESMNSMFMGASSYNGEIGAWDVSNVSNINSMFFDASSFDGDISDWDVSNVTDMALLFLRANSFNQDLSEWDVSGATNFQSVFSGASSFDQDISNWDVSNATDFSVMFKDAFAFNQDLGSWNVVSAIDMTEMFKDASIFNQDLSGWPTANVRSCSDFGFGTPLPTEYFPVAGECDYSNTK